MKPIRKGQLKSTILSACVVRLDTGDTQELSTRKESYCHFFEPVYIEDYKIIFRLDWADIDAVGHPTLDADFYDIKTNKKLRNTGDRHKAHQTKTKDQKVRIYEWEFRENRWPFKVVVRWVYDVKEVMHISDSVSFEVIRNGVRVDE